MCRAAAAGPSPASQGAPGPGGSPCPPRPRAAPGAPAPPSPLRTGRGRGGAAGGRDRKWGRAPSGNCRGGRSRPISRALGGGARQETSGRGRPRAGGEAAPVTAPGGLGSAQGSLPRRAAPQGLGSSGPWPWVCLEGAPCARLARSPWAGQELPGQPWGAGLPKRGHVHPEKPQGPCFFLPLPQEGAWECSGTGLGEAVGGGRSCFISTHLPGTAGAHVRDGEGGLQRAASLPGGTGQ